MQEDLERQISEKRLAAFASFLTREEKSSATKAKYARDVRAFAEFLSSAPVTKEQVILYKEWLTARYAIRSVNSMLASLNSFFHFMGWEDCSVRRIRTQKQLFCPEEEELTKEEYWRLLQAAERKDRRLYLILQTLGGTGIRISELEEVTAEAVAEGKAVVYCKNKVRTIFFPERLRKQLLDFLALKNIGHGPVFQTKGGRPVDRSNIWKSLKILCREAGVSQEKVFPHNLRHLFARTFYEAEKDLAKLADILGHSSMDTTRIYIVSDGKEHQKQIDGLGLVI